MNGEQHPLRDSVAAITRPDPKDPRLTETAPAPPHPAETEALLGQARRYIERAQLTQAVDLCRQVLDADPGHREALYVLAVAERYRKRLPEADRKSVV